MVQQIRSTFRSKSRIYRALLLSALLIQLLASGRPSAAQEGVVLIVNSANPAASVSREELSRIFLKKTAQWPDGTRAEPVDLAASSSVRGRFSQAVHGKDTAAIKAYWQKMIFSGREVPPAELASAAEVVAFVASHRGGAGYVAEGTSLGDRVKAIRLAP
jgi:ABC-type phosphate transport system substrate-binding protein